jgi:hypothetical protein
MSTNICKSLIKEKKRSVCLSRTRMEEKKNGGGEIWTDEDM